MSLLYRTARVRAPDVRVGNGARDHRLVEQDLLGNAELRDRLAGAQGDDELVGDEQRQELVEGSGGVAPGSDTPPDEHEVDTSAEVVELPDTLGGMVLGDPLTPPDPDDDPQTAASVTQVREAIAGGQCDLVDGALGLQSWASERNYGNAVSASGAPGVLEGLDPDASASEPGRAMMLQDLSVLLVESAEARGRLDLAEDAADFDAALERVVAGWAVYLRATQGNGRVQQQDMGGRAWGAARRFTDSARGLDRAMGRRVLMAASADAVRIGRGEAEAPVLAGEAAAGEMLGLSSDKAFQALYELYNQAFVDLDLGVLRANAVIDPVQRRVGAILDDAADEPVAGTLRTLLAREMGRFLATVARDTAPADLRAHVERLLAILGDLLPAVPFAPTPAFDPAEQAAIDEILETMEAALAPPAAPPAPEASDDGQAPDHDHRSSAGSEQGAEADEQREAPPPPPPWQPPALLRLQDYTAHGFDLAVTAAVLAQPWPEDTTLWAPQVQFQFWSFFEPDDLDRLQGDLDLLGLGIVLESQTAVAVPLRGLADEAAALEERRAALAPELIAAGLDLPAPDLSCGLYVPLTVPAWGVGQRLRQVMLASLPLPPGGPPRSVAPGDIQMAFAPAAVSLQRVGKALHELDSLYDLLRAGLDAPAGADGPTRQKPLLDHSAPILYAMEEVPDSYGALLQTVVHFAFALPALPGVDTGLADPDAVSLYRDFLRELLDGVRRERQARATERLLDPARSALTVVTGKRPVPELGEDQLHFELVDGDDVEDAWTEEMWGPRYPRQDPRVAQERRPGLRALERVVAERNQQGFLRLLGQISDNAESDDHWSTDGKLSAYDALRKGVKDDREGDLDVDLRGGAGTLAQLGGEVADALEKALLEEALSHLQLFSMLQAGMSDVAPLALHCAMHILKWVIEVQGQGPTLGRAVDWVVSGEGHTRLQEWKLDQWCRDEDAARSVQNDMARGFAVLMVRLKLGGVVEPALRLLRGLKDNAYMRQVLALESLAGDAYHEGLAALGSELRAAGTAKSLGSARFVFASLLDAVDPLETRGDGRDNAVKAFNGGRHPHQDRLLTTEEQVWWRAYGKISGEFAAKPITNGEQAMLADVEGWVGDGAAALVKDLLERDFQLLGEETQAQIEEAIPEILMAIGIGIVTGGAGTLLSAALRLPRLVALGLNAVLFNATMHVIDDLRAQLDPSRKPPTLEETAVFTAVDFFTAGVLHGAQRLFMGAGRGASRAGLLAADFALDATVGTALDYAAMSVVAGMNGQSLTGEDFKRIVVMNLGAGAAMKTFALCGSRATGALKGSMADDPGAARLLAKLDECDQAMAHHLEMARGGRNPREQAAFARALRRRVQRKIDLLKEHGGDLPADHPVRRQARHLESGLAATAGELDLVDGFVQAGVQPMRGAGDFTYDAGADVAGLFKVLCREPGTDVQIRQETLGPVLVVTTSDGHTTRYVPRGMGMRRFNRTPREVDRDLRQPRRPNETEDQSRQRRARARFEVELAKANARHAVASAPHQLMEGMARLAPEARAARIRVIGALRGADLTSTAGAARLLARRGFLADARVADLPAGLRDLLENHRLDMVGAAHESTAASLREEVGAAVFDPARGTHLVTPADPRGLRVRLADPSRPLGDVVEMHWLAAGPQASALAERAAGRFREHFARLHGVAPDAVGVRALHGVQGGPVVSGQAAVVPNSEFRGVRSTRPQGDVVEQWARASATELPGVRLQSGSDSVVLDIPRVGAMAIEIRATHPGADPNAPVAHYDYQADRNRAVVWVSDQATADQVKRAVAHEVAELRQIVVRTARGEGPGTDALTPGRLAEDAALSAHDHGRIAELGVLIQQLRDAEQLQIGLPRAQAELDHLVHHLGLRGQDARARRRMVAASGELGSADLARLERDLRGPGEMSVDEHVQALVRSGDITGDQARRILGHNAEAFAGGLPRPVEVEDKWARLQAALHANEARAKNTAVDRRLRSDVVDAARVRALEARVRAEPGNLELRQQYDALPREIREAAFEVHDAATLGGGYGGLANELSRQRPGFMIGGAPGIDRAHGRLGQGTGEFETPGGRDVAEAAPGNPAAGDGYMYIRDFADALELNRRGRVGRLDAETVGAPEPVDRETWPAWAVDDGARVRLKVRVDGVELYLYFKRLDVSNGPGPSRAWQAPTGDSGVAGAQRAQELRDAGILHDADWDYDGSGLARGDHVMVIGRGPTGAWSVEHSARQMGQGKVTWMARREGVPPHLQEQLGKETHEIEADLVELRERHAKAAEGSLAQFRLAAEIDAIEKVRRYQELRQTDPAAADDYLFTELPGHGNLPRNQAPGGAFDPALQDMIQREGFDPDGITDIRLVNDNGRTRAHVFLKGMKPGDKPIVVDRIVLAIGQDTGGPGGPRALLEPHAGTMQPIFGPWDEAGQYFPVLGLRSPDASVRVTGRAACLAPSHVGELLAPRVLDPSGNPFTAGDYVSNLTFQASRLEPDSRGVVGGFAHADRMIRGAHRVESALARLNGMPAAELQRQIQRLGFGQQVADAVCRARAEGAFVGLRDLIARVQGVGPVRGSRLLDALQPTP